MRHVWCSLCDEPHEPCEDEFACLDYTQDDWDRLDAFYAAVDAEMTDDAGEAG